MMENTKNAPSETNFLKQIIDKDLETKKFQEGIVTRGNPATLHDSAPVAPDPRCASARYLAITPFVQWRQWRPASWAAVSAVGHTRGAADTKCYATRPDS